MSSHRLLPAILLQSANLASGLGNAMVTISIPWLILEESDSPLFAGIVVALASLPPLLVSPIAGWIVDHFGRRLVSVISDLLSTLSVIAFPLIYLWLGLDNLTILLLAFFGALFDPAGYTARKTLLVDASRASGIDQSQLNGIHDGVFGIGWIAGPALGAWMIAGFGVINSFWLAGGLFLSSALAVAMLRFEKRLLSPVEVESGQNLTEEGSTSRSLSRGFIALWQDKLLRTITIAILIIAAVYLPTESIILPTYFEELGSPAQLGIVISLLAAGSTVGSFGYGYLIKRLSRRTLVRVVMIGTAVSIIPMALLPPIAILSVSAFALGLFWGPFNPLITSLIQERIHESEQGRVFGVQLSTFYAAPPLGMVLAGWSVESFGVNGTYIVLAIILSATALIVLFTRSLREEF
jgi:MFS family permease